MIANSSVVTLFDGGGSPPPSTPLSALISPSNYIVFTGKGSYTSPRFTVYPSGGTEPYSYSWSSTNATATNPNGEFTYFVLSGYDEVVTCEITCTTTDDASGEVVSEAKMTVNFSSTTGGAIEL